MNNLVIFYESSETIFWVKIFLKNFYADPDPGSGIFQTLDLGSGMEKIRIREKHPGSATLHTGSRRGVTRAHRYFNDIFIEFGRCKIGRSSLVYHSMFICPFQFLPFSYVWKGSNSHFKILYNERPSFHWLELQQAYTTQRKEITEIISRVFTLRPNGPVCMNELNEMHLA